MAEPGSPDHAPDRPITSEPAATDAATMTHGFLFADLRGYTRYVDAHGDHAAADLLDRYRTLVRGAVAKFRGAEIRTEGDSFYVVFDSASAAVRCGLAIVEAAAATADGPADAIQVGVGVHAGETVETTEGYVGSAVNIAARLCAQAKAGELVVSETVRALTRTYLDVEFEPLGTRRLKGLEEPIGIDRVVPRGTMMRPRGLRARWSGLRHGRRLARFGALGLVVVLAGAGFVVWQGARSTPAVVPSVAPTGLSNAPSPSTSVAPSPTQATGGLSTEEAALKARIPSDFQPFCVPSNQVDNSLGGDVASLRCHLEAEVGTDPVFGADDVWYDQFSAPGLMVAAVNAVATREGLMPSQIGSDLTADMCTSGAAKAFGTWSFGVSFTGQMACYTRDGGAWIVWSYKGDQIAVRAVRHDGDSARLYAWWLTISGLLRYQGIEY